MAVNQVISRSLFQTRIDGNAQDAVVWTSEGSSDPILRADRYVPMPGAGIHWAIHWATWYGDPTNPSAEEPPADVQRQMELYKQIQVTANPELQVEMMQEIMAIHKELFPNIGISLIPPGYGIVKNNLRNVSMVMNHVAIKPNPARYDPHQWFYDTGGQ